MSRVLHRQLLESAYLKGLFSIERFEELSGGLDTKIKQAQGETTGAEVNAAQQETMLRQIMASLGKQSARLPEWLKRNDPGETNRILHLIFEKIIIHRDGIELVYR